MFVILFFDRSASDSKVFIFYFVIDVSMAFRQRRGAHKTAIGATVFCEKQNWKMGKIPLLWDIYCMLYVCNMHIFGGMTAI